MVFFARHGCFDEERRIGNSFVVNFVGEADLSKPSVSDNLEDAVNYQVIYNVIKREMAIPSNLLENVAGRILEAIKAEFPELLAVTISIAKQAPPIGGEVAYSKVTMSY